MLRYMSYLFANVRKKVSTYLIPLFGMLVLLAVLLPSILLNETDRPIIGNTLVFYYFLPFIFGAMFVGTKTLNIFKDGEEDGTELLIVSKPISRLQIVFGKFFTLYALIIGYALWSFITTMIIGFIDKNATTAAVMNFAGGYAIGSLIIMVLFSAVITFFASVFGKIGTMTLSIILPALLPIVSFILVPVGKGTVSGDLGYQMGEHSAYVTETDSNGRMKSIEEPQYIYDASEDRYENALSDKRDGFYKYVSYFDVWQHMFGFYSVLQPQTLSTNSQGVKVDDSEAKLTEKDGIVLNDDQGSRFLFTPYGTNDGSTVDMVLVPSKINQILDVIDAMNIDLNAVPATNTGEFSSLDDYVRESIENADPVQTYRLSKIVNGDPKFINRNITSYITAYLAHKENVEIKGLTANASEWNHSGPEFRIFALNNQGEVQTFPTLVIKKYHSTGTIVAVYVAIALALSGLVIFRYYRRDFK